MQNLTKKHALQLVQTQTNLPFGNIDTRTRSGLTASLTVVNHDKNIYVIVRKKTYETHLLERENWRDTDLRLSRYQLRVTTKTIEVLVFYWNGLSLEKQQIFLKRNDCSNLEAIKSIKRRPNLDPNGLPWNISTHGGGMKDH